MADNSGIIKVAAIGAAAYVAYTQGWLSFLGVGAPKAAAPAAVAPNPNAIVGGNTVSAIQARTIAAAKAPSEGLDVDHWGFFLNQELTPMGKAAPDPLPLFQAAVPGFVREQPLTAGQYWAVMVPALKSQLGLSGLGLYWVVQ